MSYRSIAFFRTFLQNTTNEFFKSSYYANFSHIISKNLYSLESLKIDSFKEFRTNLSKTLSNPELFKAEMKNKCEEGSYSMIFENDLKCMISITKTDEDIQLFKNMLKKFCSQTRMIQYSQYKIGPEIARLFYTLNKPQDALEILKNQEINVLFNNFQTNFILANLLYDKEMYQDAVEIFYSVVEKQYNGKKYYPSLTNVFFAANYKINTPDSFKEAVDVYNNIEKWKFKCPERSLALLCCLALKQKQPNFVIDVLNNKKPTSILKNIEILAFSDIKDFQSVLNILKAILYTDVPKYAIPFYVMHETLNYVEAAMEKEKRDSTYNKFQKLKQELLAHNLVKMEELENILLEKIDLSTVSDNSIKKKKFTKKNFTLST